MANKLISELTLLALGAVENEDWLEIQEVDSSVTKKVTVEALTKIERDLRITQDDVIEAACGLDAGGTYPGFSGTNYLDSTTDIMDALDALDNAIGDETLTNVVVTVTAGAFYTCGGTPVTLVAAPGANKYIELISASVYLDHNGVDMNFASDKLVIQFDTAASHFMEWSNAFIESSANAYNRGTWTSNVDMEVNEELELTTDNGNNATAGNASLKVFLSYVIRDLTAS